MMASDNDNPKNYCLNVKGMIINYNFVTEGQSYINNGNKAYYI